MQCPNCTNEIPVGAKFCTFCGHSLGSEPGTVGVTAAPRTSTRTARRAGRQRWPFLALGLVALLAFGGVVGVLLLGGDLISGIFGSERILYAVQDEDPFDLFNAIMIMDANGEELVEIAYDRDGLYLPASNGVSPTYMAPNGRWFAYFEQADDTWELVLTSIDAGGPILVDGEAVRSSGLGTLGFSPDGRYFAYTTYSERTEDVNLRVVGETGADVLTLSNAAFGSFFADSQRILVIETDDEGLFDGLAWLALDEGTPNRITRLADSSGWIRPVVFPDGNRIAFYSDDELLLTNISGGAAQSIHEFDSPSSAIFLAPGNEQLVIYDQFEGESVGEFRLFNLANNQSTRVSNDLNFRPWNNRPDERAVHFSPDGELVAYVGGDPGDLDLYVSGLDGRNRRRISDENAWSTFAFSPNGRQIAFIEASSSRGPGTLNIADLDGANRLRLDRDVWSFRFIDGGRRIIYSKVDDMESGDPESEIYRIDVEGDGQELILGVQNGIITLLDVLD